MTEGPACDAFCRRGGEARQRCGARARSPLLKAIVVGQWVWPIEWRGGETCEPGPSTNQGAAASKTGALGDDGGFRDDWWVRIED